MASLDAQADQDKQGGLMAQLEGHLQTVVFELQRSQTVVAQNAQDASNDYTYRLPPHYDLDYFLQVLTDFFGGGITLASRERALDTLRQTGTVEELAIAYQNITNTFSPRWTDHSLIYVMSRKIREPIRFELAARGTVPTLSQDYIAAAINVEQNQASANLSHGRQQSQPCLPYRPPALPAPAPRPPPPPPQPHVPMDMDGKRGACGSLSNEERRRRADANLCAYFGQPGHITSSCPRRL